MSRRKGTTTMESRQQPGTSMNRVYFLVVVVLFLGCSNSAQKELDVREKFSRSLQSRCSRWANINWKKCDVSTPWFTVPADLDGHHYEAQSIHSTEACLAMVDFVEGVGPAAFYAPKGRKTWDFRGQSAAPSEDKIKE